MIAAPVVPRSSMTGRAHGWRSITRRAAITCSRSAGFQWPVRLDALDLADDDLDDAVEQVVLAPDVPVERHGIDAELLAELAHAQALDAVPIGERHGDAEHAVPGQGRAALGRVEPARVTTWLCHLSVREHLDESTV